MLVLCESCTECWQSFKWILEREAFVKHNKNMAAILDHSVFTEHMIW
jgi:hypothetical protein